MGLFGSIGDTFARIGTAFVTGGASELVRFISPGVAEKAEKLFFPRTPTDLLTTASLVALPLGISSVVAAQQTTAGSTFDPTRNLFVGKGLTINAAGSLVPITPPVSTGGPMALNIGGILGTVGSIFGGNQNPIFEGVSNVANLAGQFFPTTTPVPSVMPTSLAMLPAAGRATAMVARGFFNRFPNLALAVQQLRTRGINVKRSQLWTMLKRFGPEVLVTGGILTAAAVSELMLAGPGRRRMNPGNATALRRSLRRIESFHRLCVRADTMKSSRRRTKPCRTGGSTQFVRQG